MIACGRIVARFISASFTRRQLVQLLVGEKPFFKKFISILLVGVASMVLMLKERNSARVIRSKRCVNTVFGFPYLAKELR